MGDLFHFIHKETNAERDSEVSCSGHTARKQHRKICTEILSSLKPICLLATSKDTCVLEQTQGTIDSPGREGGGMKGVEPGRGSRKCGWQGAMPWRAGRQDVFHPLSGAVEGLEHEQEGQ